MNQHSATGRALARAIELHQLGRLEEAESGYRGVLVHDATNAQGLHLLGVLLIQTGRASEAVPMLERALEESSSESELHANLARAHHALGDVEQAIPSMRRALELAPDSLRIQSDLGALLQTNGQVEEARAIYEQLSRQHPEHVISRFNLAIIARRDGDLERAVQLLGSVIADHPRHPKFRTVLAGYLLEMDRVADALTECDTALAASPRDLMAMTLKSVALARCGDTDAARALMDLRSLVVHDTIETPPGYADLATFNADLERYILEHPTLEMEPNRNATRNGRHTGNLLRDAGKGPMAVLEKVIHGRVDRYLRELPRVPEHPFLCRRPPRWSLQAWAVVMHSQGHQLAHTHPDGWVSGVYYVRIPRSIAETDSRRAGWIEFGRPLPELIKDTVPETLALPPREGLLVMFPSYVYHETIAFESDQHRISIAFDAIPG